MTESIKNIVLAKHFLEISELVNIRIYDNGFMVEINGIGINKKFQTKKFVFDNLKQVTELINQGSKIKKFD